MENLLASQEEEEVHQKVKKMMKVMKMMKKRGSGDGNGELRRG